MTGIPAKTWAALIFFSLLTVLSLLVRGVGGDYSFHAVAIDCFAEQFWQGDLAPHWCFDGDAGLGSPLPLFYFPLPYYVASLLYPLTWLGANTFAVFIGGAFLATLTLGVSTYVWLRDIVSPGRATLASAVVLFAPYRLDALMFRSDYSELWALAFLPLLFCYARRIALQRPGAKGYALALSAAVLSNMPAAAIGGAFSAVYILLMSRKWDAMRQLLQAVALALALTAFYTVPALHYRQFIHVENALFGQNWSSAFLHIRLQFSDGKFMLTQPQTAMELLLTFVIMLPLAVTVFRRWSALETPFVRREAAVWGGMFLASAFLLFPVSEPLYEMTRPLSLIFYPYRMPALFIFAIGYFFAVYAQWFASLRQQRAWKTDFTLLLCALLLALFNSQDSTGPKRTVSDMQIEKARLVEFGEYDTVWTDQAHTDTMRLLERLEHMPPRVAVTDGIGEVVAGKWAWDGIELSTHSTHEMTLRLDQRYFPLWEARGENGRAFDLSAEEGSGLMLVGVPAGDNRIVIRYGMGEPNPWFYGSLAVSVLVACWLAACSLRRRSAN